MFISNNREGVRENRMTQSSRNSLIRLGFTCRLILVILQLKVNIFKGICHYHQRELLDNRLKLISIN